VRQVHLPIEKSFSAYLDLARFSAAVLVVVAHYLLKGVFGAPGVTVVPDLGREAVILTSPP
jgi:peptidoglycan/LPS O-acetylase OafA/YrhL